MTDDRTDVAATDQWQAFIASLLPPGSTRDLLNGFPVMKKGADTEEDYIVCGEQSYGIPSEPVSCTHCGQALVRSLSAPKRPRPICLACLRDSTS